MNASKCLSSLLLVLTPPALGAASPPQPQPLAAFDVAALRPGEGRTTSTTVTFLAENTIALNMCRGECSRSCSLFLFRWESGALTLSARTPAAEPAAAIHPVSDDGVTPASADASRLLSDSRDRKVLQLRNIGEVLRMVMTLGMSGEEWPNRERVRVVDAHTGHPCFEWQRTFRHAEDVVYGQTAAISPSGEFVAIAANQQLSIYRLPAVCDGSATMIPQK